MSDAVLCVMTPVGLEESENDRSKMAKSGKGGQKQSNNTRKRNVTGVWAKIVCSHSKFCAQINRMNKKEWGINQKMR